MISNDGWNKYCIWEHSAKIKKLYAQRCRLEEKEMTCAAQAAELLKAAVTKGDTLLDVGCGSGYFYHSLKKRNIPVEYYGIDAAPSLIEIGQEIMPNYGLPQERLQVIRIEDMDAEVDHIVCINVLTNLDNFHRPLERLLLSARKTVILRESCSHQAAYAYVEDKYLDSGVSLKVYVNTYAEQEIAEFMGNYGFEVKHVTDWHSQGEEEFVIGYSHSWTFLVAYKKRS